MVQKTFGVYSEDLGGCNLFIETGNDYIACCCKEKGSGNIRAFELFNFKQESLQDFPVLFKTVQLISRLLVTNFDSVYAVWGHDCNACIPNELYTRELAAVAMETMYGETGGRVCENILGDCVVATVVNETALQEYSRHYMIAGQMHKYYVLLRMQKRNEDENKMHIVFYNTHCTISVYKHARLQLIQSYDYKTAEDVLYYVLQLMNVYDLAADETKIFASGMIDDSSPLYATLLAYIKNFEFEPVDKSLYTAEDFDEYPLHYFVSFCENDL